MRLFLTRCVFLVLVLLSTAAAHAAPRDPAGMMAMVLQQSKTLPTADQLAALIKASPLGTEHTITVAGPNKIQIDTAVLVVLFVDQPIPAADTAKSCSFSKLYWPEACTFVNTHQSHIILHLHDTALSAVTRAQWLTHIAGALLRQADGVDRAVYWGGGLTSKTTFLKAEDDLATLPRPAYIWASFNFLKNDDNGLTLITDGMEQFGLMQIEIVSTTKKMSELWSLAGNVASYLMDKGPVIKDGDTLGYTAQMKVHIKHEPSTYYDTKEKVYRLYVDDVPLDAPKETADTGAEPTTPDATTPTTPDEAETFPPEEP